MGSQLSYTISPMHVVVASHQQLPAKGYGGPQRVVVALVRGLAALGHRVTLLAPPGTRVPEAKLVEVPPRKFGDPATLAPYIPRDGDILHAHFPLKRGPGQIPFVQTIHRNLKPGSPLDPNTIFLSRDHARRHGSETFVYNGLDPAEYFFRRFPKRHEQYDLFLGKLHSAKGYHWAVEAAKRTGHPLIVAGGWRPSFTGSIQYVGEVDGGAKAELLAPEVGALCDTMEEMIAAADTIHTRSPQACRAHAERRFTHLTMAEGYVQVYRRVLQAGAT